MNTLMNAASMFGPTAPKAAGKAVAAASTAGSAGDGGGDGVVLALGALGVMIVLGLVAYVVLRLVRHTDDKEYEKNKFVAPRKWSWELSLSQAEEDALLAGLKAWETNERSVYLSHEDGTLTLYLTRRQVLVSLFLLAERVRAAGEGGRDPASVGRILDELSAQEQPGVIAFSEDWFSVGQLDGMDNDAFLSKVRDTLTAGLDSGLPGGNGWYSDENYGRIDLRLISEPSPAMRQLQAEEKFDQVPVEESKVKNVFLLNAGPLVWRYQRLREEQPALSPEGVIRNLLLETVESTRVDYTWSRGQANPVEQSLVRASIAGQATL